MDKKKKRIFLLIWILLLIVLAALIFIVGSPGPKPETIQEVMKDGVLHDSNRVRLFGMSVNPAVISDFVIIGALLLVAALIRIFAIPRFKTIPGKFQAILEQAVSMAEGLAKSHSPHRNGFLGAYLFFAGAYIFIGTLFELFGLQVMTVNGYSVALPAPLSDINAAIALGCLSYGVILSGGIAQNGIKGVGATLKEFSLPISMSFRLFGALLSGLLVTELVYYTISLSFVLPVIVGVLFTLLHALIQTYVLTMLTAVFYGEVSEPHEKKPKKKKVKNTNKKETNQMQAA